MTHTVEPKPGLFEVGYFIKNTSRFLIIPFYYDNNFGLLSLPLFKEGEDIPHQYLDNNWTYTLKRVDGLHMIEIKEKLSIFDGDISTTDNWRIRFIRCEYKQIELVAKWLKSLTKTYGDVQ